MNQQAKNHHGPRHADALHDALERVGRGRDPRAVLDELRREGRYNAETLESIAPALSAARDLRARAKARPSAEFRARLETEVVALASEGDRARFPILKSLRTRLPQRTGFGPALAMRALPLVLALFFSLSSVIIISADSRPGDPLHPLQPVARTVLRSLERAGAPVLERLDAFRGEGAAQNSVHRNPVDSEQASETGSRPLGGQDTIPKSMAEAPDVSSSGSSSAPYAAATAVLRHLPAQIGTPSPSPETVAPRSLASPTSPALPVEPAILPPVGIATNPAVPVAATPTAESPVEPIEPEDPEEPDDPAPNPEPEPTGPEPSEPEPSEPATAAPSATTTSSATPPPSATPVRPEPTVAPPPSQTPMPTSIACGGTVSGEARDLDGALYAGPPVLIFASLHPHWSMIDTVGFAEVVDGRYSIQLEPEVCIGQAETFYLLAMDRDSGAPRGFHGDPSRPEDGPSPLSVHERERWGEPSVTIFVHIGGAPGFWEACPPEDEVGTVSGSVQDSAGDPVADAIVLLFDASAEPEPVPIDRFRDGVADAEGRFEISGVCTGSYHALAIQEDEQQSFFGFWDPDEDGQPDSFTITKEETERSGIVIHAIDPEWPEALPKPEGW